MAEGEKKRGGLAQVTMLQKLLAVGVFAAVALALYLVDRLPAAIRLNENSFSTNHNNALVVYGLPASPVMSFDGALGLGLDLRADAARLSPDTLTSLTKGGFPPPRSKAVSLTWLGQVDPQGRIALTIAIAGAGWMLVRWKTLDSTNDARVRASAASPAP